MIGTVWRLKKETLRQPGGGTDRFCLHRGGWTGHLNGKEELYGNLRELQLGHCRGLHRSAGWSSLLFKRERTRKTKKHVSRRLGLSVRRSAGKRKDAGSTLRVGSPFCSKIVIYGRCLVTLPCTINEALKWLTSLAHGNHSSGNSVEVTYNINSLSPSPILLSVPLL